MTVLIGPVLLSIVGIATLIFAWEFGLWSFGTPGAGLMPAISGALLLVASLADLRLPAGRRRPWSDIARRPAAYIAGLIALLALTPLIGMLPALAAFIFAVLYFVERLVALRAVAIAGGAVAGSWLLFERLLSVPLPKSMFW
ncbi:MAG: tripartite tricarboxylate transporter TctB family protein [Bradyrhizobium sp.]|uniref:tripartite tricarboxylate transporter TctB family protein n=1 Tax=Bradyrhizobium sp. TaxID=376 RepID=UPI00272EF4FE|nr:tripartite tricarboxylate transporter TctB family protein [Bradyrhizobium sp.]MDP1868985.1 tripartite tricarboxylate transporter TctB family protein [Bradyrhizobium sp.]